MLGFFSSKVKIEVGSLCEVQHPVSSQWVHGSVTRDEGDGYFSVLVDGTEELLNHTHSKKMRKVRVPDRLVSQSSEKSSSNRSVTSNNGSTKSESRRYSLFGNSQKVVTPAVVPPEPLEITPISEEPPENKLTRKSSIKALVDPPHDMFVKKIQRKKLEGEELLWLERSRRCTQNGHKSLDLSKLELQETIPELFTKDPFIQVPELILRKNLLMTLAPLTIFQSVVKLDVSFNMFSEAENIRDCFTALALFPLLRHLDLSGNALEHIPTEIYTLSKLETLLLRRNAIRDIPSALIACANLASIDLSYNEIATIPSVFEEMRVLNELNLDHNPCVADGVESLNASKAGEKTIFLLEKRIVYRDRQFRQGAVQHASKIQNAVLEKEKHRILTQQDVHIDEFD